MALHDAWMRTNSRSLAAALDAQREAICAALTMRLGAAFPMLCYDPERFDGRGFQQMTMRRTPLRVHKLIQTALRLQNLSLIEREYRWAWPLVQRFGVHRQHLIAQVNWYFEVAHTLTRLEDADRAALHALEVAVIQMVERATAVDEGVVRPLVGRNHKNGHKHA